MSYPGLNHTIEVARYGNTIDAEGTPISNALPTGASARGYAHEYSGAEIQFSAALGVEITGHALVPYDLDVKEQDRITVTYRSGDKKTYRVAAIRDNHIMRRLDLTRDST